MKYVIEVSELEKSFGTVRAVDGLSFRVEEGELFAFLGENGAGKSTTISIICGVLKKDAGKVNVNGVPLEEAKQATKSTIGVVFQNSVLDGALSARDTLRHRAALYGILGEAWKKRSAELTELLDLADFYDRPLAKLSGGQRRRVDIARALLHRPSILILDEPTTGLDPQTRKLLWNVIADLQKKEKLTVFLTTHYMEEAAEANHVVILEKGKVAAEGTPLELKNRFTGDYISLYGVTKEEAESLGAQTEVIPGGFRVLVKNTAEATELILAHPAIFRDYEITKGKMDDVFLAVTGKRPEGGKEDAR